ALHLAADLDHREILELLLAAGAQVNAKDKGGYTPLSDAARKGRAQIIEILLSHGAAVNTKGNETGFTPLHLAAAAGDAASIRMLLAKGADRSAKDHLGETPLEQAVHSDRPEAVEALLPPGGGSTRMDLLADAVAKGHAATVAVLLDHGTDVNAKTGA